MKRRWTLSVLILLLVCALFLAALRFAQPLYTDDIIFFMMANRYLVEGLQQWWLFPQCLESTNQEPPLTWLPVLPLRVLLTWVVDSPRGLELLLLARAMLLLAAIVVLCRAYWGRMLLRPVAVASAFTVGVMPALLVCGRPEVTLVLGLITLLLLVEWSACRLRAAWLTPYLLGLVFLWNVSLHAQTLLFLPFFVAALFKLGSSRVSRVLVLLLLSAASVESSRFYGRFYACPTGPEIESFLERYSLQPSLLKEAPLEFFTAGLGNIVRTITGINDLILPKLRSPHLMLPLPLREPPTHLLAAINALCAALFLLLLLYMLYWASLFLIELLKRRGRVALFPGAALLVSFFLWAFFRSTKQEYHAFLLASALVLLLFDESLSAERYPVLRRARRFIFKVLPPIALCSTAVALYLLVLPGLNSAERKLFDSSRPRMFYATPDIDPALDGEELLRSCGVDTATKTPHLAVDDATYFLFRSWPRLIHLFYVNPNGWGADIPDLTQFLRERGSPAYIGPCGKYRWPDFEPSYRRGEICCYKLTD